MARGTEAASAVTNHGVPEAVVAAQFRESAAIFALQAKEKLQLQAPAPGVTVPALLPQPQATLRTDCA